MKKNIKIPLIALGAAVIFLLGNPANALAEMPSPTTVSLEELIKQIQNQIESLKAQIEVLKASQAGVKSIVEDIKDTLKIISGLREGMSGEEVRLLQIALSSDPEIYPEGLVTGFYGRATAEAVRRLQRRNNIEAVGFVGPRTLEKINEALRKNPVTKDEQTGEHCAVVPPGHLIAPGWLRKVDGIKPVIPACQSLPEGIRKQLSDLAAKDTDKPVISRLATTEITTNSALISWTTNEPTKSLIRRGTTTPIGGGGVVEITDTKLKTGHSSTLTGLMSNTTYYYTVSATDASNNATTSDEYMFRTVSSDTVAPTISGISATDITQTSAKVVWTTNEPATSKIWLTTNLSVSTSGAPTAESSAFVTNHSLMFSNLTFGTVYRYVVASTDSSGNTTNASEYSFTTASGGGGGGGGSGY